MAEFIYNNAKNANISYMLFKLNYGYHPRRFFEENTNSCSHLKTSDKLVVELKKLLAICHENLHHAQKLQKQTHN